MLYILKELIRLAIAVRLFVFLYHYRRILLCLFSLESLSASFLFPFLVRLLNSRPIWDCKGRNSFYISKIYFKINFGLFLVSLR